MEKQVMLVVGAGEISLAIARRLGADYQIIVGDKNIEHAKKFEQTLLKAGFNAKAIEMDLAERDSINETIKFATTFGEIKALVNRKMFAESPAGRPGTADEVANVAELLMSQQGAFITGSTFLIDGGATANYFYGQQAEK